MFKTLLLLSLFITAGVSAICYPSLGNDWTNARYTEVTVNGDITVTDGVTGLMWKRCSEGLAGINCEVRLLDSGSPDRMTWLEALEEAKNANYAGHQDWRLPNINELTSLVAYNCSHPAINKDAFPYVEDFYSGALEYYWSSTPLTNENKIRVIGFEESGIEEKLAQSQTMFVRLVRTN